MGLETYGIRFFSFCHSNFISLILGYAFTHILFSLHTLLLAVDMPDRQAFRSQAGKSLPWTLYRIYVTAHVILKVREEDAMNDSLFAPLSNYRERESQQADRHIEQTISCVKADRRMQSSRLGSHEATGWSLATLTNMIYV